MSLADFFNELHSNPSDFLKVSKGTHFEDKIMEYLRSELLYSRIDKSEAQTIKPFVLDHSCADFLSNNSHPDKTFIYQPYGTQEYPDLLVFEDEYVIPVEIKFSKKSKKPVWNSGLPRPNGIYIFGAQELDRIAVFCGADVVTPEEARKLFNFFVGLSEQADRFNAENLNSQKYGFSAYSRKAFHQAKVANPNARSLMDDADDLFASLLVRLGGMGIE